MKLLNLKRERERERECCLWSRTQNLWENLPRHKSHCRDKGNKALSICYRHHYILSINLQHCVSTS